jgi:large subunit ribosomal protein L29
MKIQDIRELTEKELVKQLDDSRREFLNLRIQAKTGQLENTARLSVVRKDIARMLTEEKLRKSKEVDK